MDTKDKKPVKARPQFYAVCFEQLKTIAIEFGYNLLIHGSLDRDFDLIAVAWVDDPKAHEELLKAFCEYLNVPYLTDTNGLPCHYSKLGGDRSSYVIDINRSNKSNNYKDEQYYIDISFTPSPNSYVLTKWIPKIQ